MTTVLRSQAIAFGERFRDGNFQTILEASGLPSAEQAELLNLFEQQEATEIIRIIRETAINSSQARSYAELLNLISNTPAPSDA